MRRATVIEDWSRFNRAVLEAADGLLPPGDQRPAAAPPQREQPGPVPEAGDSGDSYGLIARHKWRKHV